MRIGFDIYAQGPVDAEQLWALVGDLSRLPEWTDAERVQCPDDMTVVTFDRQPDALGFQRRQLTWTVVTRQQRLLEIETTIAAGRLGIGVRVVREPAGARVILACALWPRTAVQAWRFRMVGAPAIRRRFDRWCSRALAGAR